MHDARKPHDFDNRIRSLRHSPVVMVANLKGGVGKTTLTANLAAHFSQMGKRVLLVDVDYQGSLSNMLLSADEVDEIPYGVTKLLLPSSRASSFSAAHHDFKNVLIGSAVVPARYEFATLENQLMIDYLLQEDDDDDDGRYRLSKLILDQMSASKFDIAFIDAPPRLTAGTINAFCASTHLLVPTVYDLLSAEAVGTFLNGAQALKRSLNPGIDLLGVVGMLTSQQTGLVAREQNAKRAAIEQVNHVWSANHYFFERHIPRKAAISEAAGASLAYFNDATVKGWFDELGTEMSKRIGWDSAPSKNIQQLRGSRGSQATAGVMHLVEDLELARQ